MPTISGSTPTYSTHVPEPKRILADAFTLVLQNSPGILQIFSGREGDGQYSQSDNRHEWLEGTRAYMADVLNNGGAVASADTSFVVTNIGYFKVNQIIKFPDTLEVMKVIGVNSGTSTVTVTREHNGRTAPTSVADGATIDIISKPTVELSNKNEVESRSLTTEYNYYQIFRKDISFSERVAPKQLYGFRDGQAWIDWNVQQVMEDLRDELKRSLIWGTRNAGTAGDPTDPPEMRGILNWFFDGGITSDASVADLTATMINNVLRSIYEKDSSARDLTLYMGLTQAKKMAGFNTYVANQMKQVDFREQSAAGSTYVMNFIGDVSAYGTSRIVVDTDAEPGTIMFLTPDKLKLVYAPNGRMIEWDTKLPTTPTKAQSRGLRMEATLEMKDHETSHGLLYNLKTT